MKILIMKSVVIITFCVLVFNVHSQVVVGVVKNRTDSTTIPFANIVLLSKQIGTCSNSSGSFSFDIKGCFEDTVYISSIGFESQTFPVNQLIGVNQTIFLKEMAFSIPPVTVGANKYVNKYEIGDCKKGRFQGVYTPNVGAQIATFLENPNEKEGYLKKVIIFFEHNNGFQKVDVRLRIFRYDKQKGVPDQDLLPENLIFKPLVGKMEIDLSSFSIYVPKDGLCVGIEWMDTENLMQGAKSTVNPSLKWKFSKNAKKRTWTNFRDKGWKKDDFNSNNGIGNPIIGAVFVSDK